MRMAGKNLSNCIKRLGRRFYQKLKGLSMPVEGFCGLRLGGRPISLLLETVRCTGIELDLRNALKALRIIEVNNININKKIKLTINL